LRRCARWGRRSSSTGASTFRRGTRAVPEFAAERWRPRRPLRQRAAAERGVSTSDARVCSSPSRRSTSASSRRRRQGAAAACVVRQRPSVPRIEVIAVQSISRRRLPLVSLAARLGDIHTFAEGASYTCRFRAPTTDLWASISTTFQNPLVSEDEILIATVQLLDLTAHLVEPRGRAPLAAALSRKAHWRQLRRPVRHRLQLHPGATPRAPA